MTDVTFLTKEQCSDSSRKLEILEKRGTIARITEFAILLGGSFIDNPSHRLLPSEKHTASYWTCSADQCNDAYAVNERGYTYGRDVTRCDIGARPVLPYSAIHNLVSKKVRQEDGILEVEYGEYPQKILTFQSSLELGDAYDSSSIIPTGKTYTIYARNTDEFDKKSNVRTFKEYLFEDGCKYVRVTKGLNGDNASELSQEELCWVKVLPIKWLIDEKSDLALSESVLFAGMPFNCDNNYTGDFKATNIKEFLDRYFSNDIIPSDTKKIPLKQAKKQSNPYGFNLGQVSEADIIKGAMESGVAVFLHGKSSEDKSARVKQMDPDPVIICLRNATPESLNGKSVYNFETREMIDVKPTWLKKLEDRCNKNTSEYHVLYLDEMINALPDIQRMALNIVLDREVNGMWELPENARIVVSDVEKKDSFANTPLAESVFERCVHVDIQTTVESWLVWASKHNIHPAIYAYIASKKLTLFTDSIKWEKASQMLYATGNPNMLKALVGENITKDFVEFCNQPLITLEDVLQGNYAKQDLPTNVSEKYATLTGLLQVDEANVETVRKFISQFGEEFCTTFDSLWARGDESRMEMVTETKSKKLTKVTKGK